MTEAPIVFDIGDTVELRDGGRCYGPGTVMGTTFDGLIYAVFLCGSMNLPAERLRLVRSAGIPQP